MLQVLHIFVQIKSEFWTFYTIVVYNDSERNFIRSSIHAAAVFGASVGVFCVNGDFLRDVGYERVRGSSGRARVSLCLPFSVQCVFVHI